MAKLSAVIITLNEEKNIGRCIDSLSGLADEVLVVDSGSTDRTEDISKEKGAKFIFNKWEGYLAQRQFADTRVEHQFVLQIDADEVVSDQLKNSIQQEKDNGFSSADGYEMNRMTNYCGKWIRHGSWYPDTKLRLYDRDKFGWGGERVHEETVKKVAEATSKWLKGDLLHYSFYTVSEHIAQANNFTTITAEVALEKGKRSNLLKILFSPCVKFLRDYFFKLGFLDGYYGFIVCKISAQATFMKYAKLRQLQKTKN